ncbi:lysis system i-spanin subunit Rz [Serratia oryzae]|uniref:lysis system i-spanin subunit Rz n=1 Tax=Serratia oryzae TaxID=2034155 RepID=UPI0009FA1A52
MASQSSFSRLLCNVQAKLLVTPTGHSGMDDAASAKLTDSAQRDYFTRRERIDIARKQMAGL